MYLRCLIVSTFVLFIVFGFATGSLASDKSTRHVSQKLTPQISFDHDQYDFGLVEEGKKIEHTFKVTNTGNSLLNIKSSFASCGCTVPKIYKKHLYPHETTDLKVVIDTAMKMGNLTKLVYVISDDPVHYTTTLKLLLQIKDPHIGMGSNIKAKIFSDSHCVSCHVNRGQGRTGRDLFLADCAMCHGFDAQGVTKPSLIGPSLLGPYENPFFKSHIRNVISQGSKTHPSMPGFLKANGGPLSQSQIDSIIVFLKNQSNLEKKQ